MDSKTKKVPSLSPGEGNLLNTDVITITENRSLKCNMAHAASPVPCLKRVTGSLEEVALDHQSPGILPHV